MDISSLLLIGFAAAGAVILADIAYFKPRRSSAGAVAGAPVRGNGHVAGDGR